MFFFYYKGASIFGQLEWVARQSRIRLKTRRTLPRRYRYLNIYIVFNWVKYCMKGKKLDDDYKEGKSKEKKITVLRKRKQ
jgi:hypothetical protein